MKTRFAALFSAASLLVAGLPHHPAVASEATRNITRAEFAHELYELSGAPAGPFTHAGFPDVTPSSRYANEINWLAANGFTIGRDDGTFGGDAWLTRGENATVLYRIAGSPQGPFPPAPFADIDPNGTHTNSINWLATTGLSVGQSGTRFGPFVPVTRALLRDSLEQLATLPGMQSVLPRTDVALRSAITRGEAAREIHQLAGAPDGPFPAAGFPDVPDDHPFVEEIDWLAATGITTGRADGTFGPDEPMAKAEKAAFLHRAAGAPDVPFANIQFIDLREDATHAKAINWLVTVGLIGEETTDRFGTNMQVTREQLLAVVEKFIRDPEIQVDLPNVTVILVPTPVQQPQNQNQPPPQAQGDFFLAGNGVTIMCPNAQVGTSGAVNGVTYTKMDRALLDGYVGQLNAGALEVACISGVTDLSDLFREKTFSLTFNPNIARWDTSSVTNMSMMFRDTAFNGSLSSWDTSQVTDMSGMFRGTTAFNTDITGWDTSAVTNMNWMFNLAQAFNQPIGAWDTSNVMNMRAMFASAPAFNQNIGDWDTTQVADMMGMFQHASEFNRGINTKLVSKDGNQYTAWNTSNVTNMSFMFAGASAFDQNIGDWDTSNATTFEQMFRDATKFNQNIGGWDTSTAISMLGMFDGATDFNQNLSGWCVTLITSKPGNFDNGAAAWTTADSRPDWGECPAPQNQNPPPLVQADFFLADNGVTIMCPNADWGDHGTVTIGGTDVIFTKRPFEEITPANAATTCTSGIRFMNRSMFLPQGHFTQVGQRETFNADISHWDTSSVEGMQELFSGAAEFDQDISHWDTSNVTTMQSMFWNAADFNRDLSGWDTGNVTTMFQMFSGAKKFDNGGEDLSWDTSNVADMSLMFRGAEKFNQAISFDTGKVTLMIGMFEDAKLFNKPIGGPGEGEVLNTSAVTQLHNMFKNAESFDQDIGGWDTSSVTSAFSLFENAKAFNQDIGGWNISKMSFSGMKAMFKDAVAFNQDLSGWCKGFNEPEEFALGATAFEAKNKPSFGVPC